jgi:ribose transport system ATP-binding protein
MLELVAKNISKSFFAVKALDNVDISVKSGEVHAILGENGAGKSTLIKILGGAIRPDSGTIAIDGKEILLKKPKDAIRAGIGVVYQELSLMGNMSVAQNIFFENIQGQKRLLINKNILRLKALKLFQEYEISSISPDDIVEDLSLAQKQIIEILKIISRKPRIVILDEATSALTDKEVIWLLTLAQKLASEGKIVIFISHRMNEIKTGCDRITILRNGKNAGVCKAKETNNNELVSLMLGRDFSSYFPERISHASSEVLLKTENLSVKNKLHDINFELFKGEVLGVGGLAGQGQVALFLSLFGIYPHEGKLIVNNKKLKISNPGDSLRNGIALVPEDRNLEGLIQNMSIKENLTLSILKKISKFGFISKTKENHYVNQAIDNFKIKTDDKDEKVFSLSGGNQQKVLLSKFILTGPKIFLSLDSTRGVDIGTKVEIFALMRQLAREGNAVLYYSTDIEELVNICDRVMVMFDNTIKAILQESEITKENILKISVGESIYA